MSNFTDKVIIFAMVVSDPNFTINPGGFEKMAQNLLKEAKKEIMKDLWHDEEDRPKGNEYDKILVLCHESSPFVGDIGDYDYLIDVEKWAYLNEILPLED